jgi:phospholipase/carboxylesterase
VTREDGKGGGQEQVLWGKGASGVRTGDEHAALGVIVLHGRDMQASDLAPFANALGPGLFVFPQAAGNRWWSSPDHGSERAAARAELATICAGMDRAPSKLVLVGFSQGAMLAMDFVLHGGVRPAALVLLSSCTIAPADWTPRAPELAGLRVLVAHGTTDAELPFARGEELRDFARGGGAEVTWLPFEGGHEIPMVVWRALRKLLIEVGA